MKAVALALLVALPSLHAKTVPEPSPQRFPARLAAAFVRRSMESNPGPTIFMASMMVPLALVGLRSYSVHRQIEPPIQEQRRLK